MSRADRAHSRPAHGRGRNARNVINSRRRGNMQTREIPREQWIRFFDDFSKNHEGWVVTLEVVSSDLGDQEEANGLPLVGISADVKARENRVEIILGGRPDADVTRLINTP